MARTAKFLDEGLCYFLECPAVKGQRLFKTETDFMQYIRLINKYKRRYAVSLYAFCLLYEKVFLIAEPLIEKCLSPFIQGINQSYALYFNVQHERSGHLWEDTFKNIVLKNNQDLVDCIQLIEYLPVKEGISTSSVGYPYSSCSYRILGKEGIVDSVRMKRKNV